VCPRSAVGRSPTEELLRLSQHLTDEKGRSVQSAVARRFGPDVSLGSWSKAPSMTWTAHANTTFMTVWPILTLSRFFTN
jgi:hypothetical protein